MDKNIAEIYNFLQEIAWNFGNHGFEGECCEDLSLVEFMALKTACEKNNLTIREIGNAISFTKSGATRIIDRLENKGYVKRERSPLDGRVCCVPVTEKGAQVISKIMEEKTRDLREMLKDLEPNTLDHIKEVLEVLLKAVQPKEVIED